MIRKNVRSGRLGSWIKAHRFASLSHCLPVIDGLSRRQLLVIDTIRSQWDKHLQILKLLKICWRQRSDRISADFRVIVAATKNDIGNLSDDKTAAHKCIVVSTRQRPRVSNHTEAYMFG